MSGKLLSPHYATHRYTFSTGAQCPNQAPRQGSTAARESVQCQWYFLGPHHVCQCYKLHDRSLIYSLGEWQHTRGCIAAKPPSAVSCFDIVHESHGSFPWKRRSTQRLK